MTLLCNAITSIEDKLKRLSHNRGSILTFVFGKHDAWAGLGALMTGPACMPPRTLSIANMSMARWG